MAFPRIDYGLSSISLAVRHRPQPTDISYTNTARVEVKQVRAILAVALRAGRRVAAPVRATYASPRPS